MARTLFQRMSTWARLFAKRPDVEIIQPLTIAEPAELDEGEFAYPPDAARFAKKTSDFSFHYRVRGADTDSYLFLGLFGDEADADLLLDGIPERVAQLLDLDEVEIDSTAKGFELDYDRTGTGLSAFLLFTEEGEPFVLWDLEHAALFKSLKSYLTIGAKHAFAHGKQSWPRCRKGRYASDKTVDAAKAIRKQSLSSKTPPDEIKAALMAQGATKAEADDLWEWLKQDCVLLVAKR